jgi:cytochrome bd-type quinol oxidase subunit 2
MKKTFAKVSSIATASAVAFSGLVTSAFAQATSNPLSWINTVDTVDKGLDKWVVDLLNWAIGLAALASVAMLIAAGFMYITANGDEGKVEKATKTLTFAIVGLVVCFIAVMLVKFVLTNFLGK